MAGRAILPTSIKDQFLEQPHEEVLQIKLNPSPIQALGTICLRQEVAGPDDGARDQMRSRCEGMSQWPSTPERSCEGTLVSRKAERLPSHGMRFWARKGIPAAEPAKHDHSGVYRSVKMSGCRGRIWRRVSEDAALDSARPAVY